MSGQSCLGKLSRETGQSRVPEPPERITGMIAGVSVICAECASRQGGSPPSVRCAKAFFQSMLLLAECAPQGGARIALHITGLVQSAG